MASIKKRKKSRFWYACITDANGKQRQFSTGIEDAKEALAVATAAERTYRKLHEKPHQLRAAFDRLVEEFIPVADKDPGEWLMAWAEGRKPEVDLRTWETYDTTMRQTRDWLAENKIRSFAALTPECIRAIRSQWERINSATTVNNKVKHLRIALKEAVSAKLMDANPAAGIAKVKETATKRRDFRMAEWNKFIPTLTGEWLAITWLGLNTGGQRLGDLAMLRRSRLDLVTEMVTFRAKKTDELVDIPLMPPTLDALLALPSSDDPNDFLFPRIAAMARTTRSNTFRGYLAAVGLADPVPHRKDVTRTTKKRISQELTFHSLRHTATSWFKSAGVTDGIVRSIVGHKSVAMSKVYTHQDIETTRAALKKLEVFHDEPESA